MFDALQEKFQRVFKTLRVQGVLNEQAVDETLREVRLALLEADVNFKVVKELLDRVRVRALGEEVRASLTPEQEVLSSETRRRVWQSFRELSARQQEVFVLRQLEGWSTDEVAETLGLSPGSIKRHLYRAVHIMRKALRGRL